jgi:hypothetical protein
MSKKLLAPLATVLMLTLAACGGDAPADPGATPPATPPATEPAPPAP